MRPVFIGPSFMKNAHGSCFIKFGDTHILCSATIEDRVPAFLRNTGTGWISAEYGMLPCSTSDRVDREITKGKPNPRTQEIQRLIGRSLRSVIDFRLLGERHIKIDCDVIQADGGTRTASITGGFVAMYEALRKAVFSRKLQTMPITGCVAAVSCGIINNEIMLDLDYNEDSNAQVDANFIMMIENDERDLDDEDDEKKSTEKKSKWVEIQSTAEKGTFYEEDLSNMISVSKKGIEKLIKLQKEVLKIEV